MHLRDIHLIRASQRVCLSVCLSVVLTAACALAVMAYPVTGSAAIYACLSGGTTVFQDRPCEVHKQPETEPERAPDHPLSIHESWFEIPERADDEAFCDRRGCECGRSQRKHQNALAQAVSNALFLDGSWHRYEASYEAWLAAPAGSTRKFETRNHMLDASCDVLMSQSLLRSFGDSVMKTLAKRARDAEEKGFDIEQPCLEGVAEACEYFDDVLLYSRLKQDAYALRQARQSSLNFEPLE